MYIKSQGLTQSNQPKRKSPNTTKCQGFLVPQESGAGAEG
jgi:hypothetical protein